MRITPFTLFLILLLGCASLLNLAAANATLTVDVDRPGPGISPTLFGLFFEDINFGADGGLYAELVKNRSFEFPEPLMGWSGSGVEVLGRDPLNARNPHYLRMTSSSKVAAALTNEGFRGMGVRQGDRYDFNVHARTPTQGLKLKAELLSASGAVLGSVLLDGIGSDWQKHSTTLTATGTELKGKLRITLVGSGAVDVDMVSLFPQRTWKNRAGGLRADVVQLLADMKPGFFRFPGGCIVEGSELDKRYQWKNTIGPIEERPILINRWNSEFKHRSTPDYFQTFGLGFFEYFQLCEDIGAAPLPILNCGMACQFNSGELVPVNELEPYIQDVIDLTWFDNLNVVPTPNYHAQRLFSRNRGDVSLPVALTDRRPAPPPTGRVGLATYRTSAEFKDIQVTGRGRDTFEAELRGEIILKVVNSRAAAAEAHLRLNGIQRIAPDIQATVLTGDPDEVNSMEEPDRLWPVPVTLRAESPEINHIFPPHSLTVLRVGTPN